MAKAMVFYNTGECDSLVLGTISVFLTSTIQMWGEAGVKRQVPLREKKTKAMPAVTSGRRVANVKGPGTRAT